MSPKDAGIAPRALKRSAFATHPSKAREKQVPVGGMHVAPFELSHARVLDARGNEWSTKMKHSFLKLAWLFASVSIPLIGIAACGDDGATLASELFGTWDAVSIEAEGMSTNCPGEIELTATQSVSCGTEATTFNPDGTFVQVETTDELGDPFDWRSEGTWSTQGSTLTLTVTQEGPDADNLQPIDPPETQSATWSLSGTTLSLAVANPFPPFTTVTGTAEKR